MIDPSRPSQVDNSSAADALSLGTEGTTTLAEPSTDVQPLEDPPTGTNVAIAEPSRQVDTLTTKPTPKKASKRNQKRAPPTVVRIVHVEIIKDDFWTAHPEILQ